MENAADALKMAGWVLIFVVALSICINAFTQARSTMDIIMSYSDRTTLTQYTEGNKDSSGNLITKRIVTYEEIVPVIYRAYKENYRVVFDDNIHLYESYKDVVDGQTINNWVPINYIDMEKESISDLPILGDTNGMTLREYFIGRILYGDNAKFNDPTIVYRDSTKTLNKDQWCESQMSKIKFDSQGLYNRQLKNGTFTEELGVYYQEEEKKDSSTPDANKTEKRVITYSKN